MMSNATDAIKFYTVSQN